MGLSVIFVNVWKYSLKIETQTFIFSYTKMIENECFICYTKSGKTIQERRMDNIHYKSLGYPLIQLSYAYGCNCKNMWAHNKCLRTIHKCPTCRKDVIKPQLQVAANIEKYIYLGLVKDNPSNVKIIRNQSCIVLVIIIIINALNEQKHITIDNNYILLAMIFIMLFATFMLYMVDYMTKFWLYDEKTETFY